MIHTHNHQGKQKVQGMWAYLLVLKVNLANNRLSQKKVWSILHAHLRMIVQRLLAKNLNYQFEP